VLVGDAQPVAEYLLPSIQHPPGSWAPNGHFVGLAQIVWYRGVTMPTLQRRHVACPSPDCPTNAGHASPRVIRHASHRTRLGDRSRRRCMVCTETFSATTGTVYARKRKLKSELDRVVQMRSEGMTKAAIARVLSVSPSTVARWLERAAAHARRYHDAHTRLEEAVEVQLDELSCRGVGRAEHVWAFSGLEVSSRLWVGLKVGRRTQRTTRIFVREVSDTLGSASAWTLYTTDSFKFYAEAIRRVFAGRPAVHIQIDNVYGRRGVVRTTWKRPLGSK
jgi:transposase-like protein